MKEKYIFLTLLVIGLIIMLGGTMNKRVKGLPGARELSLERKINRLKQQKLNQPHKIELGHLQDLVAFSQYEPMLRRSLFFQTLPEAGEQTKAKKPVLPVEDMTPLFVYKGKIVAGKRLVVIIEQTRSGEVSMVSEGESVDGFKVLDITDTEVILSKPGKENIVLKTIQGL